MADGAGRWGWLSVGESAGGAVDNKRIELLANVTRLWCVNKHAGQFHGLDMCLSLADVYTLTT